MNEYSQKAQDWLDEMRKSFASRIRTFEKRKGSEIEKYSNLEEWFIWSDEQVTDYGAPDAISYDVDYTWEDISSKTKKELGGKSNATILSAEILRDEFSVDVVEQVRKNTQPCYRVHDQVEELDWGLEEELGYKKLSKLIKNKKLDYGSALKLYWDLNPEYYTQYKSENDVTDKFVKIAFKHLKQLEERLLNNDFKTNIIPYTPSPQSLEGEQKWEIPATLKSPNLIK